MTTIARKVIATPARMASETWEVIVKLLTVEADSAGREELIAVTGIACSLIAEEAMKDAPIIVYGTGPRVRIYCLYDDDAITGEDANETALSFDATNGDWHMSLPCPADDVGWVQASLAKRSSRITARDMTTTLEEERTGTTPTTKFVEIDKEAFFRS